MVTFFPRLPLGALATDRLFLKVLRGRRVGVASLGLVDSIVLGDSVKQGGHYESSCREQPSKKQPHHEPVAKPH